MKGTIGLELIGANTYDTYRQFERMCELAGIRIAKEDRMPAPCWVAEVCRDVNCEDVRLRWVHGRRDYSRANSKGSRGIYVWYTLEQDRLYFVQERASWGKTERYYVAVTPDGAVKKLSDAEAAEWRSNL